MNMVKKILNTFSGQDDGILVKKKAYKGIRQVQEPACAFAKLMELHVSAACTGHAFETSFRFCFACRTTASHSCAWCMNSRARTRILACVNSSLAAAHWESADSARSRFSGLF